MAAARLSALNRKPLKPIPLEIRRNIETILSSVSSAPSSLSKPVSYPAKSIPSPRDTFEVRPFLVLCAADLVTLVNALFPEKRPSSSYGGDDRPRQDFRTASSSTSELPLSSPTGFGRRQVSDMSSLLSNSGSSVTSETVSQDPSLERFGQQPDGMSSYTSVESRDTLLESHGPESIEAYGHRLRAHVTQLSAYLGLDATTGASHPCAERWAVVYILEDGTSLTTAMPNDINDDADCPDEDSLSRKFGDGAEENADPDFERDYDWLKDAVTQLVEEYEVPKNLSPEHESKSFSNRFSTLYKASRRPGIMDVDWRTNDHPSAPDTHQDWPTGPTSEATEPATPIRDPTGQLDVSEQTPALSGSGRKSQLLVMLEAAIDDCRAKLDFPLAHFYWEVLQRFRALSSSSLADNDYLPLFDHFAQGPRQLIRKRACAIEEYDAWLVWLQQSQKRRDSAVEDMTSTLR